MPATWLSGRKNYRMLLTCATNVAIRRTITKLLNPEINVEYVLSGNIDDIKQDLSLRRDDSYNKSLERLREISLYKRPLDKSVLEEARSLVYTLPNSIHPSIKSYNSDYEVIKVVGSKQDVQNPIPGTQLLTEKDLLKIKDLTEICGERNYYFADSLAKLEHSLTEYTIQKLLDNGFQLVSVPDILQEEVINACGMPTSGERTQVYRVNSSEYGPGWCLSGTSEIALAYLLKDTDLQSEILPLKLGACSRCYRAEISDLSDEKGLYRVHQFTKVEMFVACLPEQTEDIFQSLVELQEDLYSSFDFHYRIIDMAPHELGRQANRKFDIEVWMPGLNKYGEVSSISSCTDYQARRFNIRCGDRFVHTLNGTACAVPRVTLGIAETHLIEKGRMLIPKSLLPHGSVDILGFKRGPRYVNVKYIPYEFRQNYML